MTKLDKQTGQCLCGDVRFEASGVDPAFHVCHCGMCQRWNGGPFMGVDAEQVRFDDETKINRFESSDWGTRGSCGRCGSTLFYHFKPLDHYVIAVGALDDKTALRLGGEIFIDQKPAGYDFAGDVPRLTEAETIAKFQAMMPEE